MKTLAQNNSSTNFWLYSVNRTLCNYIEYDEIRNQSCLNMNEFICKMETIPRCSNKCLEPEAKCRGLVFICNPGWNGDNCKVPYCATNCSANGICIGLDDCKCNPGWSGFSCSYSECKKNVNCKSCTSNEGCGWCDETQS